MARRIPGDFQQTVLARDWGDARGEGP